MLRKSQVEEKAAVLLLSQIIVQRQSGLLKDNEALTAPEAFEKWAPVMPYGKDQIIFHEDKLYRVVQAVTQSQAHQSPSAEGMLAIYRPIEKAHAGTKDDPIPYVYGMDCRNGLHYRYQTKLYLCKSDMLPCIWPPDSPNLWQWEAIS